MKFFQRDPWYRRLVQRSIQTFLLRRKTSSLRPRLLVIAGIGALLVSGLTFAIGGVGAIVWPNAPAGEATGGTIMTYFHNAFGDPATGTGKSCSGSGLITGFKTDGTPRCISIPDLTTLLGGYMASTTPTLTFTAPAVVMSGSAATLNWNTTNVSSCTKSGDWSGNLIGNQVNQSFTTPALTSNKSYTLTCVNSAGVSVAPQTVTINTSTLSLTTSSTSITSGQSPTLTWSATNMASCIKSWRASADTSTSGTSLVSPTVTTNYTLTCANAAGGTGSQSVNISVAGSPTLTFTATNTAIMSGSTATLNWNTTNVSSCTKSGDWSGNLTGNQNNQSFITPALTSNKSYTLTCVNSAGASVAPQTVNITVTAPTTPTILMPTPSPSTVNAGSSITLSWNATPATSCTTTGPSSDTSTWAATGLSGSGSRTFTPTVSGNYTVTCYNGSVSSSQTVNITLVTPPPLSTATNITSYIDAGYSYTCAIEASNNAICWDASNGSLLTSFNSVKKIYGGMYHVCVIKLNNTVECWGGDNYYGQTSVPNNLTNVAQVSVGAFHTCALKFDGDVICWGSNSSQQSTVPATIDKNARQVLTTFYGTCALKIDSSVECWGSDAHKLNQKFASIQGSNVTQITFNQELAKNDYLCKLTSAGRVYCDWLYSIAEGRYSTYDYGQTSVPASLGNVQKIVAGKTTACGLKTDSSVECWGNTSILNPVVKTNILDITMGSSTSLYTLDVSHTISARGSYLSKVPASLK